MALHGIYYGVRKIEGGKYGILVKTFERGEWIETDENRTPWPDAETAADRAYRAACGKAGNYNGNMPVIRSYWKQG